MLVRPLQPSEQSSFDAVAGHPLQSWAWGDFKEAMHVEVERLGVFDDKSKLSQIAQVTIHRVPKVNWLVGYAAKISTPTPELIEALQALIKSRGLVYLKLEPNLASPAGATSSEVLTARTLLEEAGAVRGKALFTPYSFVLDIGGTPEALLEAMKPKTRYNIRVASKHGVTVRENNSKEAFDNYLKLLDETTQRQSFYAHSQHYHRTMWHHMHEAGIAYLLEAVYQETVLATWVVFCFNGVLYYPYGASSRLHREVMATNLLAFEAIIFGKSKGCTQFDMWGCLPPKHDPKDPWAGFHRFKEGYGGTLMEFVGTYDLVSDQRRYELLQKLDHHRWQYLRMKKRLPPIIQRFLP